MGIHEKMHFFWSRMKGRKLSDGLSEGSERGKTEMPPRVIPPCTSPGPRWDARHTFTRCKNSDSTVPCCMVGVASDSRGQHQKADACNS
jgi:hypothetical protein